MFGTRKNQTPQLNRKPERFLVRKRFPKPERYELIAPNQQAQQRKLKVIAEVQAPSTLPSLP